MDKQTGLILRLQDEADLCRNDGANDIAALLDEAVARLGQVADARGTARTQKCDFSRGYTNQAMQSTLMQHL